MRQAFQMTQWAGRWEEQTQGAHTPESEPSQTVEASAEAGKEGNSLAERTGTGWDEHNSGVPQEYHHTQVHHRNQSRRRRHVDSAAAKDVAAIENHTRAAELT